MPNLQTFEKSMNFANCIGLQLRKMKFYSSMWSKNVKKRLYSQFVLDINLNSEIFSFITTGGHYDHEKGLILEVPYVASCV